MTYSAMAPRIPLKLTHGSWSPGHFLELRRSSSCTAQPWLKLAPAAVHREWNGAPILRINDWSVSTGEVWAITGPAGCGKTTLAETALGRHIVKHSRALEAGTSGRDGRAAGDGPGTNDQAEPTPRFIHDDMLASQCFVSFREQSGPSAGLAFHQRFNWVDADDDVNVWEYLEQGLQDSTLNGPVAGPGSGQADGANTRQGTALPGPAPIRIGDEDPYSPGSRVIRDKKRRVTGTAAGVGSGFTDTQSTGRPDLDRICALLGLTRLLDQSFITLSNGQTRRARLAKALLQRPRLLVLDEPYMGLDTQQRGRLTELLAGLNAGSGGNGLQGLQRPLDAPPVDPTELLLVLRPQDGLPSYVSHVLALNGDGSVQWAGYRDDAPLSIKHHGSSSVFIRGADRLGARTDAGTAGTGSGDVQAATARPVGGAGQPEAADDSPVVAELRDVTVRYGNTAPVQGVDWTIRAGEAWALQGPNGSGKSTLLSLLAGNHLQAYSNDVRLFGAPRGSGESIWDLRSKIGFVSPELHLSFQATFRSPHATVYQIVATGLRDTFAYDGDEDEDQVRDVLRLIRKVGPALRPRHSSQGPGRDSDGQTPAGSAIGTAASTSGPTIEDTPFASLSTAQQRLVLLARALVKRPPLLLLDEPFQGMDEGMVAVAHGLLAEAFTALGNAASGQGSRAVAGDVTVSPSRPAIVIVTHHEEEFPAWINRVLRLDEEGRVADIRHL